MRGVSSRVFETRGKNRPKGGTRGGAHLPGALVTRLGVGPRHLAVWEGFGPPSAYFYPSSQKPSRRIPHREIPLSSAVATLRILGALEVLFPTPCRRED